MCVCDMCAVGVVVSVRDTLSYTFNVNCILMQSYT